MHEQSNPRAYVWGYSKFKEEQLISVVHVLSGRDAFVSFQRDTVSRYVTHFSRSGDVIHPQL